MLVSLSLLMLWNSTMTPPVNPPEEEKQSEVVVADKAATQEAIAKVADEVEQLPDATPERITLGSADTNGPYRMLLTLDNVGAGVQRLELSSEHYRDLDDRTGYLGQLGLIAVPEGAKITTVGDGTPAAEAKLQVGDVIKSVRLISKSKGTVDGKDILSDAELTEFLSASKPRDVVELQLLQEGRSTSKSITLMRHPLNLIRPETENIALHDSKLPEGFTDQLSFLVRLSRLDGFNESSPEIVKANQQLAEEAWLVDVAEAESKSSITFRKRLPELAIEVAKRFTLVEVPESNREDLDFPGYHFNLSVEIKNLAEVDRQIAYELTGPNGLPIEGHWYALKTGRGWSGYGLRDIVVKFANGNFKQHGCSSVVDGDVEPMGQGVPLAYAGVDAQYFASIVIPEKKSLESVKYAAVKAELATEELDGKSKAKTWNNPTCVFMRQNEILTAAGSESDTLADGYQIFAGPKLPALLKTYKVNGDAGNSLSELLYYGWFGAVSRVMLGLLHFFNSIIGNYGIAIILLTCLVRACMFPLSRSQAKNMLKMQELKPEMDRLAEKYKDDVQKRSQAQQELFRKNGYNPAAGCLPIFIQLPIFLGLYRALAVDVELRQAPLFTESIRFCSNLAAPDMLFDWSGFFPGWFDNGDGMFALGPYFNLLPIATVILFLLQQKLFMPEASNDQMRLQQQLMKYMMGFMGLLFFKVASGLCIYFIASSVWGIAERKLFPPPTAAKDGAAAVEKLTPTRSTVNNPNNGGSQKKSSNKKKNKKKRR